MDAGFESLFWHMYGIDALKVNIDVYDMSMKKSENMRELEYLASSQWGLFTTAQASALGVRGTQVSRMVTSGAVEVMRRGVYRYTVGEETCLAYVKAAWLAAYPVPTAAVRLRLRPFDAVVAGRTAAVLHGIGDLHEDPYTFIVIARRQTSAVDLAFHMWPIEARDITFVEGLPVTTMERTIADLVRERQDPGHVRQAATEALKRGMDSMRLESLLGGLGASYSAAVEGIRLLVGELSVSEDASLLVDAMCELKGLVLELSQKRFVSKDDGLPERMAGSLTKLERAARGETRPDVALAAQELAASLRTFLETMHGPDGH